ncbi:MAG: hypothetical protein AAF725_14730 [Acidobacteriota bacterium]
MPNAEAPYILDPVSGYPLSLDAADAARLREMFGEVRSGGDLQLLETAALGLVSERPDLSAARVVAAQAAFLRQQNERALGHLRTTLEEFPTYLAAALLAARIEERLARVTEAYERYRDLSSESSLAARRAADLEPRAVEIVFNRFEDSLGRGRFDDAESALGSLKTWRGPSDLDVLDAEVRLLSASGDSEGELEVVRELVSLEPRPEAVRRQGELEIEIGEVRTGLDIFERLAAAEPEDVEIADWLARAKFLWQLDLLPPEVQALGRQGELDRAELATLLYWLFPDVRYSEVENPPIAADILEHPRRREILRVLDVDLLGVDPALHSFRPSDAATRRDLLASLLTLMVTAENPLPCVRDDAAAVGAAERPQSWVCARASDCRLIEETLACLPSATLAGAEALELVRSAQKLTGVR